MTDSGYAFASGRHASSPSWSFPLLLRRFVHGLGRQPRSWSTMTRLRATLLLRLSPACLAAGPSSTIPAAICT